MAKKHLTLAGERNTDEWGEELDEQEWDRRAFHIKSTNAHDHARSLNIPRTYRFPPQLVGQMEHFVHSDETPYRSIADLIRDAVVHRIQFLAEESGLDDFAHQNGLLAFRSAVEFAEDIEQDMAETIDMIRRRAIALHKKGDTEGLIRLWDQARDTKIDPNYRHQWESLVAAAEAQVEQSTSQVIWNESD